MDILKDVAVGIDVDGVLRDFITSLRAVYAREHPDHIIKDQESWELHHSFPMCEDIYDFAFNKHGYEIMRFAPAYVGYLDFIKRLKILEAQIVIVTNQPNIKTKKATFEWILENIGDLADSICIINSTENFNKGNIKVDVLLDDCVDNLIRAKNSGIKVILMRKSWNENSSSLFNFVDTFGQALHAIIGLQKGLDKTLIYI